MKSYFRGVNTRARWQFSLIFYRNPDTRSRLCLNTRTPRSKSASRRQWRLRIGSIVMFHVSCVEMLHFMYTNFSSLYMIVNTVVLKVHNSSDFHTFSKEHWTITWSGIQEWGVRYTCKRISHIFEPLGILFTIPRPSSESICLKAVVRMAAGCSSNTIFALGYDEATHFLQRLAWCPLLEQSPRRWMPYRQERCRYPAWYFPWCCSRQGWSY